MSPAQDKSGIKDIISSHQCTTSKRQHPPLPFLLSTASVQVAEVDSPSRTGPLTLRMMRRF
jgi:hypothetical protein